MTEVDTGFEWRRGCSFLNNGPFYEIYVELVFCTFSLFAIGGVVGERGEDG